MKPLLFTLFLFLVVQIVQAQSIVLNNPNQTYPIFEHSAVLEGQSANVTIDSLLKHPATYPFVSAHQQIRAADTKKERWFRFIIRSSLQTPFYLYAELDLPFPATLYQVYNNQFQNNYTFAKGQNDFSTTIPQARTRRSLPLYLQPNRTYIFYWHSVEMPKTIKIVPGDRLLTVFHQQDLFVGFYYGFVLIIILYNLLLYARLKDSDHLIYAIWTGLQCLVISIQFAHLRDWLPDYYGFFYKHNVAIASLTTGAHILFGISFLQLRQRSKMLHHIGIGLVSLCISEVFAEIVFAFLGKYVPYTYAILPGLISLLFTLLAGTIALRKGFKPAWYYVLGVLFIFGGTLLFTLSQLGRLPSSFWTLNGVLLGSTLEIILFLLALTYKVNLLKQQREEAIQTQLTLYEENQRLIEQQNTMLEQKVDERTAKLKASQAQLIQKEKLASLGELTAGIAHEIQNPLNFVNNFSEISTDLVNELREGPFQLLPKSEKAYSDALLSDLRHNLQKINHHGNRASSIVKGMLEHSRTSGGERQRTDLNKLVGDYLRLAYQGQRAKDSLFNCQLVTSFDPAIPTIHLNPQDIGRVLLNLYSNAFYSVRQREKQQDNDYQPILEVSSQCQNGYVALRVRDNGVGIQESIKDKLFQPFFTTKPPGEGTGLGLSLSYDIVTKGYSGALLVDSQEGSGAAFTVQLPI